MLDVFATYATDAKKEIEGVWKDLPGDAKVLVARAGNRAYAKALEVEVKQHKHELDKKDANADKVAEEMLISVMASTVLLGWSGISFKGKKLPYSVDNAKTLLQVKDFRQLIANLADDIDNFKAEAEEEAAKN